MKKKYWITVLICFVVSVIGVTIGSFAYKADNGEHFSWYVFVFVPLVFTALIFAVFALLNRVKTRQSESFEMQLSRFGFNTQKSYTGHRLSVENTVRIGIDFDSKQFACNLIYRYVVPFSRIASGRIEVLPYNMANDKCVVQYVIAITRKDNDTMYDYIELFNTVVSKSELGENDQLTQEMIDKYSTLKDMLALNEDIQKIVQINIEDGAVLQQAIGEEWNEQTVGDETQVDDGLDYDPNENSNPNYTKPPFSNKRW